MTTAKYLFVTPLISFLVTFAVAPIGIVILRRLKAGQTVQKEGPESHASKAGTPAMGGLIILVGLFFGLAWILAVAYTSPRNDTFDLTLPVGTLPAILLILAYSAIGFADDWLTVRPRNGKRGISSKPKFLLQLAAAIAFVAYLHYAGHLSSVINMGFQCQVDFGWAYPALAVLLIVGMSNFVNITDGLDGLASGLAVICCISVFMLSNQGVLAYTYLALAGSCAAFLWFNCNPAKVFMGDTGSLAIGAAIPALAIVTKTEIPMIIAGMVFILDGLSSALQWAVFKYTRIRTGTGKRVFRMSPVHHHFELSGWPEQLVVVMFWIAGGLCALLALLWEFWR